MRKNLSLMVLLLSLVFLWGCELALIGAGAGIGVAANRYIEGSVSRDYPLAYNKAWETANTAISNLALTISSSVNEGVKGTIEAVRKDGTPVAISIKDRGQGVSSISVRVGNFGSRSDAQRIHEEIYAVAGLK
ncbi:MAG: DUF3568 family protein [Nitrospirae bacterium]|nr:DUF3568 family protein [Nitrospirota bacterium]